LFFKSIGAIRPSVFEFWYTYQKCSLINSILMWITIYLCIVSPINIPMRFLILIQISPTSWPSLHISRMTRWLIPVDIGSVRPIMARTRCRSEEISNAAHTFGWGGNCAHKNGRARLKLNKGRYCFFGGSGFFLGVCI